MGKILYTVITPIRNRGNFKLKDRLEGRRVEVVEGQRMERLERLEGWWKKLGRQAGGSRGMKVRGWKGWKVGGRKVWRLDGKKV